MNFIIGGIILAGISYASWQYFDFFGNAAGKIEYKTEKAMQGNIQSAINVDGRVVINTWNLGFLGSGVLDKINVSLGDRVEEGQLLAQLNLDDGMSRLVQAKAELDASILSKDRLAKGGTDYELKKEAYENAKNKLEAEEDLYDEYADEEGKNSTQALAQKVKIKIAEGDVEDAKKQLDQVGANYENSLYQLEKSRASYDQSKYEYAENKIVSPVSGARVAQINGAVGDVLSGNQNVSTLPLIVLADEDNFWFEADIEDADALKVSSGMKVYVKIDSYPDYEFSGETVFVSPVAELDANGIATYKLVIRFDKQNVKLLSDMSGSADLVFEEKRDVLSVSTAAIKEKQGKQIVIVKDGNGFEEREVRTGFTNGKKVEIISGLRPSEDVVIVK